LVSGCFAGRDRDLQRVGEILDQAGTTAWVHAEGGMGKSSLARHFVEARLGDQAFCLWVDATNGTTLASGYDRLAHELNLPARHLEKAPERVQAVRAWLARTPEWLLVLDNLDNPAVLREPLELLPPGVTVAPASPYLPDQHRGRVLITSRTEETGWLQLRSKAVHRLEKLSREAAEDYVLPTTERRREDLPPAERDALDRLLAELDGLPLALEQAAAYVRSTRCPFTEYWMAYQRRRLEFLAGEKPPSGYPLTVATTWALNFAAVEQDSPAAAALLKYLAYLSPDGTPWELFLDSPIEFSGALGQTLAAAKEDPTRWRELLRTLRRHSLVSVDEEPRMLRLHRLVQRALEDRVQQSEGTEGANARLDTLVEAIVPCIPGAEFEHKPWWDRWFGTVQQLASLLLRRNAEFPAVSNLLNGCAQWHSLWARYAEAEPLYRRALAVDEQNCGPEHHRVSTVLQNLAILLKATNRMTEAEPLYRRALKINEQSYGPDHPKVATVLNNLAMLLKDNNRLVEAEPLMRRALKIGEHSYGPDHHSVATRLNNLAQLLTDTNRLMEAEPLMLRALKIHEQSYGPDHPDVAEVLNNLACLLKDTNRLPEAEPLMRQALKIFEQSYGPNHPRAAIVLNNLAQLLQATNRLTEAEPLMRRVLKIQELTYGPDHADVAEALNNLACLLKDTNRLTEAQALMRRALHIHKQSYGPEHPKVARVLNNIAIMLMDTNHLAEAEVVMREALAVIAQSMGGSHPITRQVAGNLIALLVTRGRVGRG
jgi:tetratricopeptide (TPR) repeat protein